MAFFSSCQIFLQRVLRTRKLQNYSRFSKSDVLFIISTFSATRPTPPSHTRQPSAFEKGVQLPYSNSHPSPATYCCAHELLFRGASNRTTKSSGTNVRGVNMSNRGFAVAAHSRLVSSIPRPRPQPPAPPLSPTQPKTN